MTDNISRREGLKRGLAAAGLLAIAQEWNVPALAQSGEDIPFTDYPATYKPNSNPAATNHLLDIRTIDVEHNHARRPVLLHATLTTGRKSTPIRSRLKFAGHGQRAAEFSLARI